MTFRYCRVICLGLARYIAGALSGQVDDKGKTGTAGVIGAVALLPIAGFFTTGTSASIPLGAPVTAFVDEDMAVAFAGGAPTPMMVAPTTVVAPAVVPAASAMIPAVVATTVKK